MATAAPAAAPSTAAPAAPVAAPAADGASNQPAIAAPRTIKPIPPSRPRLPGVLEDGPEDASTPEAVEARARDAAGRFTKTSDGTPIVERGAEGEPKIPDLPEAKPKFKFAGREFATQAEAEHYVRSMEGRYKPIQEAATRDGAQLVKAAESARGWHSEAQRLAARVAELEAGGGNPTPAAESAPTGIDWGLYAEIAKVAAEAGEPWKAQQWLQEQTDTLRTRDAETLRQEIARLRDEAIEGPQREAAERAQLVQTADALVNSMAAHENPDGSPAFPEFRDGEQAREIGKLWQSLGLDSQIALTPGGAVAAVGLYRLAKSMNAAPTAPPQTLVALPDPAAEAAAGLDGGRPLMPAASGRSSLDPSVARLVAGLKSRELFKPGLGFDA